jgi:hypothetical protein
MTNEQYRSALEKFAAIPETDKTRPLLQLVRKLLSGEVSMEEGKRLVKEWLA